MKKLAVAACLLFAIVASGCQSRTDYGECLGLQDNDLQRPELEYRPSVRNIVLGVIFVETLFAPAIWLLADFNCPVAYKQPVAPTTVHK